MSGHPYFLPAALLLSALLVRAQTQEGVVDTAGDTVSVAGGDSLSADTSTADSSKSRRAARDTVGYDADMIEYDINTKILLLTGNGVVRYRGMVLFADTIHYDIEAKTFIAGGHPMLVDEGDTVVGTSMVYNLETRRGRVSVASATSGDTRYNGEFIAKSDSNVYYIEDGDYTSCAVIDSPHYTFYGHYIKVEPGERAISRPIILNIADAPVASLPYYVLPLQRGRRSGWLRPRFGGNPAFGGYLENIGYYWAPNDYMDYSIAGKVREFQEWVFTGAGNYALRYWLNGYLSGQWAQSGDFRQQTQRWSLNFSHNQNLLPDQSLTLAGGGNVVSDKRFYRDFSEDTTELLNQNITANLSLNKRFQKINASASATWRRSHNLRSNDVDEDLPSLNFSLPSRPLIPQAGQGETQDGASGEEAKWYNKIYYGYSARALQKRLFNVDSSADKRKSFRGANHSAGISSPQKILKYFTISPSFDVSQSLFDAYIDTNAVQAWRTVRIRDTVSLAGVNGTVVDSMQQGDSVRYVTERDTSVSYTAYDTTYWWSDNYNPFSAETHSYNIGARLSTNLYGLFPIRIFNFAGMRHTLSPSVGYSYSPPIHTNKRYPSFGIPADGGRLGRQTISISAGNLFQGKVIKPAETPEGKPEEKKFNIVSGNVSASYNFNDEGEGKGWDGTWSTIQVSASTSYKFLNVSYGATYSIYDSSGNLDRPVLDRYSVDLRPSNLAVSGTLWGGDLLAFEKLNDPHDVMYANAGPQSWRFSLTPSYQLTRTRKSRDQREFTSQKDYHLTTSLSLNFTSRWSVSTGAYYNFMTNKFEGMSFAFRADLECWDLSFDWHPSGWNTGSFWFVIGIKRHRDIKWEHREP